MVIGIAIKGRPSCAPIPLGRPDDLEPSAKALHGAGGPFGAEAETRAPRTVGEVARLGALAPAFLGATRRGRLRAHV